MDNDDWDDDDADDEEPTIPCPYCKREIHEESQRCPHCGSYISEEDAAPAIKPWWIIIGVLLVLAVIYIWLAG